MQTNAAQGVRWNLADLYKSPEDPRIEKDLAEAEKQARRFEKKYKPLLKKPAPAAVARLLIDYKRIVTILTKPNVYAHLYFAEKTDEPARGAFLQGIRERTTHIQSHILFWEVEWNRIKPGIIQRILKDKRLAPDRHYLENLRVFAPHTLGEAEEKILSAKSNTSGGAFSRLFDEVMNGIPFYYESDGVKTRKTEGEILALFHSPDRKTRQKAQESLAEGLVANTRILTYTYNMILADHRLSLQLRSYKHPSDPRNLANETTLKAMTGLVKSVQNAQPLVSRYYELKRRLLGLETLMDYDRYAPISTETEAIPFEKCREIVLSSYYAFSEKAGRIPEEFFEKHWIDAEIREGKQSGGFCCETTPDLHPYILVNYTGTMRDVSTVAHELGHGLHQYLSRKAGVLESSAPLTLAETASVFGEMIVFEKIVSEERNPREKLKLICGKIDDQFATVFRQIALTDFELMAHDAGLKEGELSEEKLNGFWVEANTRLYRKSVTLTDTFRHGWKYIPHFVHTPFYCYAYSFAQLFVLALYQRYKEDPGSFVPKYFRILELGGSKHPEEIARIAGLDIKDPDFWKNGLNILEQMVIQAEVLARHPEARRAEGSKVEVLRR